MARTIYFPDGSSEVLFTEDPEKQLPVFERIIEERLGKDALELFHDVANPPDWAAQEQEMRSYEASCESYRNVLSDVHDELEEVVKLLQQPGPMKAATRLNIIKSVKAQIDIINNEL